MLTTRFDRLISPVVLYHKCHYLSCYKIKSLDCKIYKAEKERFERNRAILLSETNIVVIKLTLDFDDDKYQKRMYTKT